MSSFIFLISISFQSCEKATNPELEKSISLNKTSIIKLTELDLLAKQLAITLKNDRLKDILKTTLEQTSTREFILDAKTFLEKEITLANKITTSLKDEILSKSNTSAKTTLNNLFSKLENGKIDIYFPLFEHFTNWYENKTNLKVGYINPKKEWDPVNVYSLNGEHDLLDAHNPPSEPVLMINYCEHYGNHTSDFKFRKKNTKQLNKNNFTPEFLDKVRIKPGKCEEPWGSGVPEIMCRIKNKYGNVIQYLAMQSGGDSFFDCGCCGFLCLGMCHDYGWKSPSNFFAYVWTPDEYYYTWEWWENDDGPDWETQEENDAFDDDLGLVTVYKSDSYSKEYNTSHMSFYVSDH